MRKNAEKQLTSVYEEPTATIIRFDNEDIITTSDPSDFEGEWDWHN